MRIGLLIYGSMDILSGGYLYNRKLVAYLQRMGDQVEIISLPAQSYWRCLCHNVSREYFEKIAAAKVDILIEDELAHPSLVYLNRKLTRQLGLPVITLVHLLTAFDHHPWYSSWLYRAIERRYLQSLDGIIVNSQTTLAQTRMLLHNHLPPHCIALPAGDQFSEVNIPPDFIATRARQAGPLRILVVGNVIRRKGVHVLIGALQECAAEDFQVVVAGRLDMEPEYVAELQQLIASGGREQQIIFKGTVEGEALANLYREHQLMVLPSAYESFGIVYVEAQQFGLPVIGTTGGAAREIIDQGENGYLIAPEDSNALASLLQNLQQNRQLLLQLSERALHSFSRYPSWDKTGETIRQYLVTQLQQ
ncbi:MAG TPA: glycosyltransferase family 4 protein [Cellvibrio sp.]|nr:glycosyltransferase family 4 protein [Cellvibrio sp.]